MTMEWDTYNDYIADIWSAYNDYGATANGNTLQHTAPNCNTTHIMTTNMTIHMQRLFGDYSGILRYFEAFWGILRHCEESATWSMVRPQILEGQLYIHFVLTVELQHPATPCNTLQHPATPCNMTHRSSKVGAIVILCWLWSCNTLKHIATHCNTLQHTAIHCNTLQHDARILESWLHSHCMLTVELQHTATRWSTLQHTAT